MAIIVQKYGGTSLQTTERIRQAANRIIGEREKGNQMVVVVSAMGDSTNHLEQLSREVSSCTNGREKDLLLSTGEQVSCALMALALQEKGQAAIAMTGEQAGIEVEYLHGNAKVTAIHTKCMKKELQKGKVVIVAGFQGVAANGELCTLGRGGSDTTAAALAAALKADRCDICTDVDGVYTADPRVILNAAIYSYMDYDSLLTMAEMGAGVIHPRAVAHAKEYQVPLVIRSSFSEHEGTWISKDTSISSVAGVTYQKNLCHVRLFGRRMKKEKILRRMKDSGVIGTKDVHAHLDELLAVVKKDDLDQTISMLDSYKDQLGVQTIQTEIQKAAIHLIFVNEEEKRKQTALMNEKKFMPLEDVHSIDSHPAVWSVSVQEEYGSDMARRVYDVFMTENHHKFPLAY
ncbi:aspartate kinase [Halobacillus aidingensis]|uniref:Aspartokinase n=1 Tax=Halobacillus aidingensis TaxID=240303 RepID=A0A1H0FYA2_HALAD|nr:aspartate kinase [Halobacillus aidingensis]SDN99648.1 aspartate kinase [Halobacillus aidingensis]